MIISRRKRRYKVARAMRMRCAKYLTRVTGKQRGLGASSGYYGGCKSLGIDFDVQTLIMKSVHG